jgi:molecular chaperone DnaK (HSP70)
LDASTIAGLTCLRLMNDTTAGIEGSHCSFFP